jgi:putative ABC transport system permease protein
MIGLAVIVAMGVFTSSMSGGFMGVVRRSLGSDYLLIPPAIGVWSTDVGANRDLADQLRQTRGVGVVSTMRYAAGSINGDAVSVLGIDPVAFPQAASLDFSQGDANTAYAQLAAGRALIANGILAKQENLKVGDLVEVSTATGVQTYYVAGLAGDYMNAKLATAYISHASIQNDFNKTEDIFIQFNLTPGADRAVVEPKIKEIVADYPQFQLVSGEAYFEQTQQLFQVVFASLYVLLTVLALPSLIAILNTLAIGVIERTREIGMLRAIGSTQGQVRQMVIAEALLLAATGTAFGLLAGLYLGYVMIGAYAAAGFPVEFSVTISSLIVAVAVGLLFGVAAAIIPARQAARMEIVRALRYE